MSCSDLLSAERSDIFYMNVLFFYTCIVVLFSAEKAKSNPFSSQSMRMSIKSVISQTSNLFLHEVHVHLHSHAQNVMLIYSLDTLNTRI